MTFEQVSSRGCQPESKPLAWQLLMGQPQGRLGQACLREAHLQRRVGGWGFLGSSGG